MESLRLEWERAVARPAKCAGRHIMNKRRRPYKAFAAFSRPREMESRQGRRSAVQPLASVAKARSAASRVIDSSVSPWAMEVKPASKAEGAR
ncbi:hypothetical protein GCM10027398_11000 [Azotobacter salinestris]